MKETNMEHYRGEIEKNEYSIAMVNGKLTRCKEIPCEDCSFGHRCVTGKIKWLMSEYKPEPVLTQREKHFVEFIQTGYIARDENGRSDWYERKPLKRTNCWYPNGGKFIRLKELCANDSFPFITWEDEEPWSLEELRKLKVAE